MKKQSTLFPESQVMVLPELDLKEAEKIAVQVKASVGSLNEKFEVAGSIRRQKSKAHDIDFVVVTRNDAEWKRIKEKLKNLKAKPNCSGNSVIKAFLPAKTASSKWTSTFSANSRWSTMTLGESFAVLLSLFL